MNAVNTFVFRPHRTLPHGEAQMEFFTVHAACETCRHKGHREGLFEDSWQCRKYAPPWLDVPAKAVCGEWMPAGIDFDDVRLQEVNGVQIKTGKPVKLKTQL